MRSTRNQPFCWQEKKINRLLRVKFVKNELSKLLLLYATITEMDSDFNNRNIKHYTKSISTYSGLSKDFIPQGLKKLRELGIIEIVSDKEKGKFKGKRLVFTPEKIQAMKHRIVRETADGKTVNGKPVGGKIEPSEDIIW